MPPTSRKLAIAGALAGIVVMGVGGIWIGSLFSPPDPPTLPASETAPAPEPPAPRAADLATDFSDKENPHRTPLGTWSFNVNDTPLPHVDNWAGLLAGGTINGWGPAANRPGQFLPFICQMPPNLNAPDFGADFETGDVIVTSTDPFNAPPNTQGSIAWTSNYTGTVAVNGSLWPTRRIGRQNHWDLLLVADNQPKTLASGELPEDGSVSRSQPSSFKIASLALHEGDVLKLQLIRAPLADPAGDFAGITFTITQAQPAASAPAAAAAAAPASAPAPAASAPVSATFIRTALILVIALLGLIALALAAIVVLLLKRQRPPAR